MFTRHDERFAETAANPVRRRAAIQDFTRRRNLLFWCALAVTLAVAPLSLFNKPGAAGMVMCAAIHWAMVFKFEGELRLLRVIERLHPDRDAAEAAHRA